MAASSSLNPVLCGPLSNPLKPALLGREVQNPAVRAAKHPPVAYRSVWWSAGRRLQRDESPLESALPVQIRQPARTLLENPISGSHALGVSGAFVDHHHRAGLPIHNTSENAATVERRGPVFYKQRHAPSQYSSHPAFQKTSR